MTGADADRLDLTDALAWVAKAAPVRPSAPVLAGVRLTFAAGGDGGEGLGGGTLTIAAFDYDTLHVARVAADVTSPGEILVPGHLATDMVRALKGDRVRLAPGDTGWGLVVSAGRSTFHLPELPLEDYPKLPDHPPSVGTVPAGQLQHLVKTALGAAGRDDMLPTLTGLHLTGHQDQLTAGCTDRFRIHRTRCRWQPTEEFDAIIPGQALRNAVDGLRGMVDVGWRKGQVRLSTEHRTVTIRTLDVEFPKLDNLIPDLDACTVVVDVDVEDLRSSLARARLALEANHAAQLTVTPDSVEVTASLNPGAATGSAADVVDARVTGVTERTGRYEIGFNPVFLADALACLATPRALIGLREKTSLPALLLPHDPDRPDDQIPDTAAVVMPRRVLEPNR